jgi:hypothetical protein
LFSFAEKAPAKGCSKTQTNTTQGQPIWQTISKQLRHQKARAVREQKKFLSLKAKWKLTVTQFIITVGAVTLPTSAIPIGATLFATIAAPTT